MSCGVQKILVCAPSNAAIDEIVLRVASKGLFGTMDHKQLAKTLLRIGAYDYDPVGNVKHHTLDFRIFEHLRQNNDLPNDPLLKDYRLRMD